MNSIGQAILGRLEFKAGAGTRALVGVQARRHPVMGLLLHPSVAAFRDLAGQVRAYARMGST